MYLLRRVISKTLILFDFLIKQGIMEIAINLKNQEKDLIQACVNKERWAQKSLYESYYGNLMGVCLRYSNNREDALDILHDGFIKIFKHIEKYKPGTSLVAWMRRIMVNTAIDFYRKEVRRRTENLDKVYNQQIKGADAISQMSEQEVLEAVRSLTPSYRTVFNLYVIEGFSHKEIAKKLDITESTSRSNLVKARMKLKNIIKTKFIKHEH